ncbi:5'-methylthioadenosine/adenosylhomocysteine nucleosidase [Vallitalea okinawensis]|uniref:5'-methylthioadenosine/adenosylhomocysteine nucleosidase n=1 Tax=Vallitalea okinawensis TaxID=2078660 RepID=UPI00241E5AC1|nr:5'-methylthioadenosine/adenosylhomocysteine nucleosidase [Vallitalea okinawensis]
MIKKLNALIAVMVVYMMIFTGCTVTSASTTESKEVTVSSEQVTETVITEPVIKMMNTIGIIGAMEEEVTILKDKMDIEKKVQVAGMTFYQGTLHNQNIILARSGVGKVNAATCAQLMITLFDIDYLINSGVAGGMYEELKQGDIVISTDAVQHDFDVTALGEPLGEISRLGITYFEADEDLINLSEKAAESINLEDVKVFKGRIASGDQFVAGGALEERIQTNFAPYAVEMEGAAIAHVAYLNEIPYVIIRAISDNADGEAELSYPEFLPIAAKNASTLLEEIIRLAEEELPVLSPSVELK